MIEFVKMDTKDIARCVDIYILLPQLNLAAKNGLY